MLVEIHPQNPNHRELKKIIDILNKDGIIIFPTDTIYAMACKLDSKKGIEKMCKITGKKIEKVNFSLICSNLSHIAEYTAVLDKAVFRLMKNNLPGAFTFILKANNGVSKYFAGNKKTIGIRVPNNAIAQAIVEALGVPLVATSIHHDNDIIEYMTEPYEIHEKFEHIVDCVIDGGLGGIIPSTIIDCSNDEIEITRQGKGLVV